MSRVAEGDMRACREVSEAYMTKMYRFAVGTLNDTHAAEDVVQEAFLRLWKIAPKWKAQAQIGTWLHRVVYNLCIDILRKTNRYSDTEVPELADPAQSPIEARAEAQTRSSVLNGINQLPERQKIAVLLVHFEECSNIEAAARMDISVDALESLLARGRRKLKDLLLSKRDELSRGAI